MSIDDILIAYRDGKSSELELRSELRRVQADAVRTGRAEIRDYIAAFLAEELNLPADQLAPARELQHYGVDSLASRRLMRDLAERFDVALAGRDMLEHRTLDALTGLVQARVRAALAKTAPHDFLHDFRTGVLDLDGVKKLISQGLIA